MKACSSREILRLHGYLILQKILQKILKNEELQDWTEIKPSFTHTAGQHYEHKKSSCETSVMFSDSPNEFSISVSNSKEITVEREREKEKSWRVDGWDTRNCVGGLLGVHACEFGEQGWIAIFFFLILNLFLSCAASVSHVLTSY